MNTQKLIDNKYKELDKYVKKVGPGYYKILKDISNILDDNPDSVVRYIVMSFEDRYRNL